MMKYVGERMNNAGFSPVVESAEGEEVLPVGFSERRTAENYGRAFVEGYNSPPKNKRRKQQEKLRNLVREFTATANVAYKYHWPTSACTWLLFAAQECLADDRADYNSIVKNIEQALSSLECAKSEGEIS